jgi:hypothetical protein
MMNPMASRESSVEQERHSWVEREQRFKDLEEDFQRRIAAAATPEDGRELKHEFGEERRSFRQEAVELGKRSPGLSVAMHQIIVGSMDRSGSRTRARGQASIRRGRCPP